MKHLKLFESFLDNSCVLIGHDEITHYYTIVETMSSDEIKIASNQVSKIEEFLGRKYNPSNFIEKKTKRTDFKTSKWGYKIHEYKPYGYNKACYTFFRTDDGWVIASIDLDHNCGDMTGKKPNICRVVFNFKCDQGHGLSKLADILIDMINSKNYRPFNL